jgi:hypothetical protein
MAIHGLLEKSALGPEEIRQMTKAYDLALERLGMVDRAGPLAELLAAKIVAIAKTGECDPAIISKRAVRELGILLGV